MNDCIIVDFVDNFDETFECKMKLKLYFILYKKTVF